VEAQRRRGGVATGEEHGEGARWRRVGAAGGGVGAVGGGGGGGQVAVREEGAPAPQAPQQAGRQEHRGGWLLLLRRPWDSKRLVFPSECSAELCEDEFGRNCSEVWDCSNSGSFAPGCSGWEDLFSFLGLLVFFSGMILQVHFVVLEPVSVRSCVLIIQQ